MVRFKNRYLVVEIQTAGSSLRESHTETELLQVLLVDEELRAAVKESIGEFELARLIISLKVTAD